MMTIKGKDFKKAVSFIKEFLLKLPEDSDCAELRDSLNLALLHMKKYFKTVWILQEKERNGGARDKLAQSLPRGSGPSSLHQDDPDRFHWKWKSTDRTNQLRVSLPVEGKELPVIPLILQATKEGDMELVEQLIEKDPMCVHATDDLGRNSVMYAAHYDRLDCLDVLLKAHADPSVRSHDDYTACHVAVHSGNWEALEKLMAHDSDIEFQDNIGRAPLHWAALLPDIDCLDMLLKADVNRSPRDSDGLTPAMWACHVDNKAHFDLITSCQHKVEEDDGIERDRKGRTWIHWAVRRSESLECLDSLLSPATAAIKDKEGRTAIHLAASLGALDACRLIVSKVSPDCLNEVDRQNRTCLHLATIGGHGEVVNFLLDHGADVNRLDIAKKTAWDYAEEKDLHYCKMIIDSYHSPRERAPSRGRSRQRAKEENNNSIPNSGNTPSVPPPHHQQQQLSPDQGERIPSPPHQPRPYIQAPPAPKRGHSPRRPTPNRPTHPHTGMVPSEPQTEVNEEVRDGLDQCAQEEGSVPLERAVISPLDSLKGEAIQYRESSEGQYVQSQEGAIIDSDMQPSSQVAEKEALRGPRNPRGRSGSVVSDMSEQSINFGMDVSDIEGEDGAKEEGRVSERLMEPVVSPGWKPQTSGPVTVNQKLSIPPRPPSPALANPGGTTQSLSLPSSPSHAPPTSSPSPSAPPMPQITPFNKSPLQSPQSPPPPTAPPHAQNKQHQPQPKQQPLQPQPQKGGLTSASPRRLMPLGDPLLPQTLSLPDASPGVGSVVSGGKGKKKKKRKGSAGSGGSKEEASVIAPAQPIAPIRSSAQAPEPDFALRPPSPGFLSPASHPNDHPTSSNQNSTSPTPTPTPRSLNRSPQPPISNHPPHPTSQQIAPLQPGGGAPKLGGSHPGQMNHRNGGAWEVSWEPKSPGMPAPPVTPRDSRGGGGLTAGSLLPQAPPQGGMLLDRGKLPPRGSSPQPAQISPRGNQNKSGNHHQSGLTELQRPRTPQMPVTARFQDTRGSSPGSLPAHPPGKS